MNRPAGFSAMASLNAARARASRPPPKVPRQRGLGVGGMLPGRIAASAWARGYGGHGDDSAHIAEPTRVGFSRSGYSEALACGTCARTNVDHQRERRALVGAGRSRWTSDIGPFLSSVARIEARGLASLDGRNALERSPQDACLLEPRPALPDHEVLRFRERPSGLIHSDCRQRHPSRPPSP
jgi:hypothetical protein